MTLQHKTGFRLGDDEAAFIELEHLSILAASHGPDKVPLVARAVGRRLSTASDRITLFFPASDAHDLISHATANGMIAVVFALPATHQALQLKGFDAQSEKVQKADSKLVASYCRAFVDHLGSLGYPRAVFEALMHCEPDDIAALSFTPAAAFSQTPGPGAGRAIGATK